ncbi:MAG: hypothetical protein ACREEL_00065 [Stellaceae bacterium]
MPFKARKLSPGSGPVVLAKLDQRTREARLMAETRASLIHHLGGDPSPVQAALVDRIALLTLHVALFDRKALEAGGLDERDSRSYLAYSNSLARALRQLGLQGVAPRPPSLADYLRAKAAGTQPEPIA